MAKVVARDRNVVAKLKAQRAAAKDEWIADDGRVIKLKKADMLFVQMASSSIDMPEVPTYTVKIGKSEREFPIDEVVIKQTEDPQEKLRLSIAYRKYLEELGAAYAESAYRSTAAIFMEGTEVNDEMVVGDARWQKRMRVGRWKIPEDSEERWVLYLQTSLTEDEIQRCSTAVAVYSSGVPEEMIGAAEATFPDTVSTDGRSEDMDDSGSNTGDTD